MAFLIFCTLHAVLRYFVSIFTLYHAHSRVSRWNLVLRHSVLNSTTNTLHIGWRNLVPGFNLAEKNIIINNHASVNQIDDDTFKAGKGEKELFFFWKIYYYFSSFSNSVKKLKFQKQHCKLISVVSDRYHNSCRSYFEFAYSNLCAPRATRRHL